ncbi:hypothetical protein LTR91_010911 [Friedmanniomyces endolithicus]|uniref:NAD(P)-binding domain-containing protein n=1 Tax=Friedmanniomyces endolithicus TaxID=329885 RepID=A0AAN6QSH1_9PEZI|nr:hypothetical protein LTR94_020678 [Friedmanniomyces endolithicus]KAK0776289.1 hypothetical protein LTR75_016299 [Friedmanniomyces endolithicus]KAK0784140.1 hypothetical protein LTR59_011537 [Friedmanniomyces endolithicus]KAK0795243.1 hypothetical protein LTR38_008947 [Friedmanniomyces endolithicus]KAK0847143.1 hypothetical protein LTR03_006489 [Friedmanniomyces endolithicus]
MKILLTGATGTVGTEILDQAIAHNYIEHIYCLVRKPLNQHYFTKRGGRGKVTQLIQDNFLSYPDSLTRYLRDEGVEGCVWALGSKLSPDMKRRDEEEKVRIGFPVAAAEALAKGVATGLSPQAMPRKKFPFRFVFVSASGAEQDQFRTLWLYSDWRKMKGAMEKGIFDVADNSEVVQGHKCFEAIALRAGQVLGRQHGPRGDVTSTLLYEATYTSIAVDRLAKCAIKTALMGTGDEKKRILENKECLGDDWASINTLS